MNNSTKTVVAKRVTCISEQNLAGVSKQRQEFWGWALRAATGSPTAQLGTQAKPDPPPGLADMLSISQTKEGSVGT